MFLKSSSVDRARKSILFEGILKGQETALSETLVWMWSFSFYWADWSVKSNSKRPQRPKLAKVTSLQWPLRFQLRRSHLLKRSFIGRTIHWKNWCFSWSYNTLATWCKDPTHWKRPQCWEGLKAGGEVGNRGWNGWISSLTQWTWTWQTLGDSKGQWSLACYSPWGCKELDTTEGLNKNKI